MKKDVIWGYLSQFLQYSSALLVLPVLLRALSSFELGIWYVFMAISALIMMLDMGLSPTLARNISYIMSGAKQLLPNGHSILDKLSVGVIDYQLLTSVVQTSRKIFFILASLGFLLLATFGTYFIFFLTPHGGDRQIIFSAWGIFAVSTVINLYFKYYTPLLQGQGLFAKFYKASSVANLSFIIVTALLVTFDFGLIGVSLGFLSSTIVSRILSWHYLRKEGFFLLLQIEGAEKYKRYEIFNVLWHNAWRLGVGVICAFLIQRASILLSSVYLGLVTTAAYAMTLQVFSAILSVASVAFNIHQPQLARLKIAGEQKNMQKLILKSSVSILSVYVFGALVVVFFGNDIISEIGSKTELLPVALLIWVAIMLMLELIHSTAATIITIGNQVPFVGSSIVSGIAVLLISLLGLHYGNLDIYWLIGVQFTVQLLYNNWKWPYVVYVDIFSNKQRVAC